MKHEYLGDSYDIVKQAMLNWLKPFGEWAVQPLVAGSGEEAFGDAFAAFLGARLISSWSFDGLAARSACLAACSNAGNLFLDPDTGIACDRRRPRELSRHVLASELVDLVLRRPSWLTLVFDQSFARGEVMPQIQEKLRCYSSRGVAGFAYKSHACFFVLAGAGELISQARIRLLQASRLPANRLVMAAELER